MNHLRKTWGIINYPIINNKSARGENKETNKKLSGEKWLKLGKLRNINANIREIP